MQDVCALMEVVYSVARCGGDTDVSGACAAGLRLALPLVTPSLLALPRLAHAAYRMLRDLESCDQVLVLPSRVFVLFCYTDFALKS